MRNHPIGPAAQHPAAPRRRRWPRLVALVAVLVLGGGGAAFAFGLFGIPRPAPAPAPTVAGDPDGGNTGVQAHLVQREDNRIRAALRTGVRAPSLKPIVTKESLPTLVLVKRAAPYTAADLVRARVLAVSGGAGLLTANVFVGPGAVLAIDGRQLSTLRLTSGPAGFTTLVTWGGSLRLGSGLSVTSWDPAKQAPDTVSYDGRAYVRANTGDLRMDGVNVTALGFWSGRTGGVAWTGDDTGSATGTAVDSSFTGNHYGLFLSRSADVRLDRVRVTRSIRDGIRIHRGAMRTLVTASTVSAAGDDGIVVSRGSQSSVLQGVTSTANTGTGLVLGGRSLASSATVSGAATTPTNGTVVDGATITANRGVSVRVHGGVGTILRRLTVRGTDRGIVLQDHAKAVSIERSTVTGTGSAGLVLDGDEQSVVSDSRFSGWRTGIQLRSSRQPVLRRDTVTDATLFGLSFRGQVTTPIVDHCTLSGRGPRAVDVRRLVPASPPPVLTGSNIAGWRVAVAPKSFQQVIEEHPALWAWTLILIAPPLLWQRARARAKLRPGNTHPYTETTKWSPDQPVHDTVPEIRFDGYPSMPAPSAWAPAAATTRVPAQQPSAPPVHRPAAAAPALAPPPVASTPAKVSGTARVPRPAQPTVPVPGQRQLRFTAPRQPAPQQRPPQQAMPAAGPSAGAANGQRGTVYQSHQVPPPAGSAPTTPTRPGRKHVGKHPVPLQSARA